MRFLCLLALTAAGAAQAQATPSVQTDVVAAPGIANGVAIWVNGSDAGASLVLVAAKAGGLNTYDLQGHLVQQIPGILSNVDLRYGVQVTGTPLDVIAVASQTTQGIAFYTVSPTSDQLVALGGFATTGTIPLGVALYRDPAGNLFVFSVVNTGAIDQYQVLNDGTGHLTGVFLRVFSVPGSAEGAAVDDAARTLFVSENTTGIWRFGADADAGTPGTLIDTTDGGHLTAPVTGLALDVQSTGAYLLASSSGNSSYNVYDRSSGAFLRAFVVGADGGLTAPQNSIGIAFTSAPMGPAFPFGLFAAQDNANGTGTNVKYVPWQELTIADAAVPDGGPDGGGSGGPRGGFCTACNGTPPPQPAGCQCGSVPFGTALFALLLLLARRRAS